jgi:hypothetical protein
VSSRSSAETRLRNSSGHVQTGCGQTDYISTRHTDLGRARIGVEGAGRSKTGTSLGIMKVPTLPDPGVLMPALPSWLITPLWDQFRALLTRPRRLAAVLTTCADRRRGGCRTCWLAPRSWLAHVQPRECPPSLTSVCPVIHSSMSPITHSTRLAISCGRRCWPPTNPKPHPTSQRRWQHSIVTWYRACHRVHLLPPAGRPGFPLGNELGGLP